MANIEKLIQVCGYILKKYNGALNCTKLTKILYLADKEALKESAVTISEDDYICLDNGPVLSFLYDLIRNRCLRKNVNAQTLWNARFARDGYELIALTGHYPDGKLSRYEKDVLDRVDDQYHSKSHEEMIDLVRSRDICPEWRDPRGSSLPLPFADVLRSVGYSDDEIEWAAAERGSFAAEEQILGELAELDELAVI